MKEPRPSKTTMSPRWMSPVSASGRHTVIESSTSRVGCIEALGMVKRWMTKPRIDPPRTTMRIAMAPIVFQNRAEDRRRDPKVASSCLFGTVRSSPTVPATSGLFADASSLAAQFAQVVELRTTDITASEHLDLIDVGRVHREGALHPDAEAELTDGEGLADSVALAADDDSLEHLDTRARALDHLDVNVEGVAGAEFGNVGLQRGCINNIELLHGGFSCGPSFRSRTRISDRLIGDWIVCRDLSPETVGSDPAVRCGPSSP